jgi:hypothetical protein
MFEDGLPNEEPDWLQQGDVVAYLTSSDIQHPWFSAYKKIESAEQYITWLSALVLTH